MVDVPSVSVFRARRSATVDTNISLTKESTAYFSLSATGAAEYAIFPNTNCSGISSWRKYQPVGSIAVVTAAIGNFNRSNNYSIKVRNPARIESACRAGVSIEHDSIVPEIVFDPPAAYANAQAGDQTVSAFRLTGTCSDGGRTLSNRPLILEIVPQSGESQRVSNLGSCGSSFGFNVDLRSFPEGSISFRILLEDAAGNEGRSMSRTIVKDTLAPTNPSIVINDGDSETADLNVMLSLAAVGATKVHVTNVANCVIPSGAVNPWELLSGAKAWEIEGAAPNNSKVFAKFMDAAGNMSDCVFAEILFNSTLPYVTFTKPLEEEALNSYLGTLEIRGTCSSPGRAVTVNVYMIDSDVSVLPQRSPNCTNARTWSVNHSNLGNLGDGSFEIRALHSNAARVTAENQVTFHSYRSRPVLMGATVSPVVKDLQSAIFTIEVPAGIESGNIVTIGPSCQEAVLSQTLGTGTSPFLWNLPHNPPFYSFKVVGSYQHVNGTNRITEGMNTVAIRLRDIAGNLSDHCQQLSFLVDSAVPVVTASASSYSVTQNFNLTGSCELGAGNVLLEIDSISLRRLGACFNNGSGLGIFSIALEKTLFVPGSSYDAELKQSDAAGNEGVFEFVISAPEDPPAI